MAKKSVSLAVGRGEKLPVSKGAGLTAKGRAKYNAATGSNLKAPQPQGGARTSWTQEHLDHARALRTRHGTRSHRCLNRHPAVPEAKPN